MSDLSGHFSAVLDTFLKGGEPLAVAVSGGADSLALCLLAAEWADKHRSPLLALTVDHRLRPESAAEAEQLHDWLAARGIAHETLTWQGAKPETGVQAGARDARYRLLAGACARHGIKTLLLGHHAGDQAETMLMRLFHGSGPHGLAGMAMCSRYGQDLVLLRPLLQVQRQAIEEYLSGRRQPWIEDPSNRSRRYERVRIRQAIAEWGGERLTMRLSRLSQRLAGQKEALGWALRRALDDGVSLHACGYALADAGYWRALPPFLGEEVLMHLAGLFAGASAPAAGPRRGKFERLCDHLRDWDGFSGTNIAGAEIRKYVRDGRECLLICRERGRNLPVLSLDPGGMALWDRRFRIRLADNAPAGLSIRALGDDGAALPEEASDFIRRLPAPVRPTLPVVWQDDICLGLPLEGTFRQGFGHILAMIEVEFAPLARIFAE